MKQCEMIIKFINDFGSITTMQAFSELGITRLASRIHDLQCNGYEFNREIVKSKNRYGEPVHFLRYSLKDENDG